MATEIMLVFGIFLAIPAENPLSVLRASIFLAHFLYLIFVQDESQDFIKRQQLRELAMLNSSFREDSPGPSGSVSPFNTSGMKRAKTGR